MTEPIRRAHGVDFDRVVDQVVRDMTDAPVPARFAARVAAALPERRRPPVVAWHWKLVPVAAGALVVTWMFVGVPRRPGSAATQVTRSAANAASPAVKTNDVSRAAAPVTGGGSAIGIPGSTGSRASAARAIRGAVMSESERAWRNDAVAALPAADPITIDAIQPETIVIAPLSVTPLAIAPIDGGRERK